jgi:uncharacterized protein YfbU (UPF0304 family)
MAKVISFKSRDYLGGCDTKENDELVEKKGYYIGVLTPSNTEKFRALQEKLELQRIQINQLIEEFDEGYSKYYQELNYILSNYNYIVKSYNREEEKLFIGEDGHMWIVKKDCLDAK